MNCDDVKLLFMTPDRPLIAAAVVAHVRKCSDCTKYFDQLKRPTIADKVIAVLSGGSR